MTDRLRFLHVTTFYPPYHFGGDGAFVRRLAHALGDVGHDVDVVHSIDAFRLLHAGSAPAAAVPHPRVRTHGLSGALGPLSLLLTHQTGRPMLQRRALAAVMNNEYDVIHFHNVSLFGPGVLEMPVKGQPVRLYTTHEHWLICPTHVLWKNGERACDRPTCLSCTIRSRRPPQLWRYTGAIDRAARHVDAFISPSRFTAAMHRERGFTRPFQVLPLFVDTPSAATSSTPPHPRPYFLYVGRLERLKGVDTLVRAWAAVTNADLLLAGNGSQEGALRELAASNPRVQLLGGVSADRLGPLYAHAIATIIPSLTYEVFPTVALESLAAGTPIIARDIGGLPEIVQDSGGGFVYRTDDDLHQAVQTLAAGRELRQTMGDRGRNAVADRWSRDAHLGAYFRIIDAIRASRRPS